MKRILTTIALAIVTASAAQAQVNWLQAQGGAIPNGTITGGHEANGDQLFPCTAPYAGGFHPGKVRPGLGGCNIGYGGSEVMVYNYEIPTGFGHWANASNGNIPNNAIQAGAEANGQPLYVCRAWYSGGIHPGKVRPGFRGCNIGYGGSEIEIQTYDVLTN